MILELNLLELIVFENDVLPRRRLKVWILLIFDPQIIDLWPILQTSGRFLSPLQNLEESARI